MAHKAFSKWIIKDKLYAQIKIADELWYNTSAHGEKMVHLFRIGWDEMEEYKGHRLCNLTILWLSIKIGF